MAKNQTGILDGLNAVLAEIGNIFQEIVSLIQRAMSALLVVISACFNALFQFLSWLTDGILYLFQKIFVDFVWDILCVKLGYEVIWQKIVVPVGVTGVNLIGLVLKSIWYGPFGTNQLFQDGIMGAPSNAYRSRYLAGGWIPQGEIEQVLGAVTGVVLGLRNWIEIAVMALKGVWYGCFRMPDAYSVLPATHFDFTTTIGKCFGVLGLFVGLRNVIDLVCNSAINILKGVWYGSFRFPQSDSIFPPPQYDFKTNPGKLFGIFGLFIGVRNLIDIAYACITNLLHGIWYGAVGDAYFADGVVGKPDSQSSLKGWRRIFGLFGLGVGLRNVIDMAFMTVKGLWYGSFRLPTSASNFYAPQNDFTTPIGKCFGIFGLFIGLRNVIDIVCTCVRYLFKGIWYGVAGDAYFAEGVVGKPDNQHSLQGWHRIFGLFGLGVGLRNVIDMAFMALKGFWYGAFRIPPHESILPQTTGGFKTSVGKCFGIFGLFIGLRNVIDIVLSSMLHVLQGIWYGVVGDAYFKDGLLGKPNPRLNLKGWQKIFGIYGLGIGLRNLIDMAFMALKGLWYGSFRLPNSVTALGQPQDDFTTPIGKCFGMFGLFIGLRNVLDIACTCVKNLWQGIWYGMLGDAHFAEGFVGKPDSRYSLKGWRRIFGIFGLGVGLRNVIDFALLAIKGFWLGCFRFPKNEGLFDSPQNDFQTVTGKCFGIFGLGIGLRNLIDAVYFAVQHTIQGIWYGALGDTYFADGLVGRPDRLSLLQGWRRVFGIFGLGIGLRNMIDSAFLILKGMWYGNFRFPQSESSFRAPQHDFATTTGKCFGIFGLFIGLRNLIDAACFTLIHFMKGIWYGVVGEGYFADGTLGKPDSQHALHGMRRLFGIAGLGIGLRNVLDLASMLFKGLWLGMLGKLSARGRVPKNSPWDGMKTVIGKVMALAGGILAAVGVTAVLAGIIAAGLSLFIAPFPLIPFLGIIGGVLAVAVAGGVISSILGLRNLFDPDFYGNRLIPFIAKVWNIALKPIGELALILVGFVAYAPIMFSMLTIRKLYGWTKNIVYRPFAEFFDKSREFHLGNIFYSGLKLATVCGIGVAMGVGLSLLTGGLMIPVLAAAGAVVASIAVIHYMSKMVRWVVGSPRFWDSHLRHLKQEVLSNSCDLQPHEVPQLNQEFRTMIQGARRGRETPGLPQDRFTILRPLFREAGLRSKDETILKRMHELFCMARIEVASNPPGVAAQWNQQSGNAVPLVANKGAYQIGDYLVQFNPAKDGLILTLNPKKQVPGLSSVVVVDDQDQNNQSVSTNNLVDKDIDEQTSLVPTM